MPKQEQTIVHQLAKPAALAISYKVMQQLGWSILYAGENSLQGFTPVNWKTKGESIVCEIDDGFVKITSEMVHNELADITGKNKKNCQNFYNSFSKASNLSAFEIAAFNKDIDKLKETTAVQLQQDEDEQIEVDEAMNLSRSNLYITYGIMAANLIVFVLMALDGAGIMEPNGYVHLKWGSNFAPLTLSGDWWRLLSNIFIHFGIIHLGMNMYCLYIVGVYLEPMLGKVRYLAAYLCTGVLASLVSLWWHTDPVNSAGASGAVFGLYGVFLALLTSNLIPKKVRSALLQNILFFVTFNLLYGLKGGIDNAAHIGGLLTGIAIGYVYMMAIRREKDSRDMPLAVPVILLITIIAVSTYLTEHKTSGDNRTQILNEISAGNFKDSDRFNEKLNEFDKIQGVIDSALGDTSLTYEQLSTTIDDTAFPQFEKAATLLKTTNKFDISPAAHRKATLLLDYIAQKKIELQTLKELCTDPRSEKLMLQLTEARKKSEEIYQQAIQL